MLPLVFFFILPAPLNSMHRFKLEIFEEKISAICSKVAAILSLAPIFLRPLTKLYYRRRFFDSSLLGLVYRSPHKATMFVKHT